MGSIWAFIRTSTATSAGATPSPISPRIPATSASSSASADGVSGDRRLRARLAARREPLRAAVGRDQAVGELEDLRRGAVVPRQVEHARARMPLAERRQEVRRRAGERVDRLVDVADDAQVRPVAEPQLEQPLLERARVLVLVDAEPALPGADRVGGLGVVLEQPDGLDEEVVEVDPALSRLRPLVVVERPNEEIERDRRLASGRRRGRPRARTRAGSIRRDFAHSISSARSFAGVNRKWPGSCRASRPRIGIFESRSWGIGAPSCRDGQKWRSWLSAWAWNVRAVTPGRPSDRSRSTISPAALSVNVTTRAWSGGTTSVAIA